MSKEDIALVKVKGIISYVFSSKLVRKREGFMWFFYSLVVYAEVSFLYD